MSEQCIFCRIISGEVETRRAGENEAAVAFYDTSPQAPIHVLVVPRQHISGVRQIGELPAQVVSEMLMLASQVAHDLGIGESGFRLVTNDGPDSGQSVRHLHWHVLGGKALTAEFA
jgi:histidine triad (HIT) family protein